MTAIKDQPDTSRRYRLNRPPRYGRLSKATKKP